MTMAPEYILAFLTDWQHLRPHGALRDALAALCDQTGACQNAALHAAERLDLPAGRSIGRLRRTELTQLARAIHRHATAAIVHPNGR